MASACSGFRGNEHREMFIATDWYGIGEQCLRILSLSTNGQKPHQKELSESRSLQSTHRERYWCADPGASCDTLLPLLRHCPWMEDGAWHWSAACQQTGTDYFSLFLLFCFKWLSPFLLFGNIESTYNPLSMYLSRHMGGIGKFPMSVIFTNCSFRIQSI